MDAWSSRREIIRRSRAHGARRSDVVAASVVVALRLGLLLAFAAVAGLLMR
ncbi:hypothetical protein [Asanoa iriomotensis]|uniref:hypothetical protein n=1 Tax=Asanoa iriomotensis TaxID=234613 RepID=UPI0019438894|nr:hypothetical protein [Asanoa iriomotensis]